MQNVMRKCAEGKATMTILVDPEHEDKLTVVQNELGSALLKLQKMEQMLLGKLDSLAETEEKAKSLITMM